MVPKVEREKDYNDCRQCKHRRSDRLCIMADIMPDKERKRFVEQRSGGCYWFDSIKWG